MKIQTKYHGEAEIDEKEIWHFKKGIPGFLHEKEFVIFPLPENNVYGILQSLQTPSLGFVVVNPFHFFPDYSFDLDEVSIEQLQLENGEDIIVYAILTLKEPFEKTTVNLQAPVIMNSKNHMAKQIILNNSPYKTKHLLLPPKVEKG